jgi:hypothetical protein
MSLFLALFLMTIGVGAGWLVGYMHSPGPRAQYATPELHRGVWGGPMMQGVGDQRRVVWESRGGYHICTGTNHGPVRCTIGPGMAHLDECMCGATRSGVFGVWSS